MNGMKGGQQLAGEGIGIAIHTSAAIGFLSVLYLPESAG
jgi:hypothetical protein